MYFFAKFRQLEKQRAKVPCLIDFVLGGAKGRNYKKLDSRDVEELAKAVLL